MSSTSSAVTIRVDVCSADGNVYGSKTWIIVTKESSTTEITYSPTALPAATAGTAYSQVITLTGASNILGANVDGLPEGCGAECKTDGTGGNTLTFSWRSPVEGTYSVTLQVFYGSEESSQRYDISYALVVNARGGGEEGGGTEEGGTTGGDSEIATYSPTPVAQYWASNGVNQVNSDACITMKIGQRTNLTVNVSNADGVAYGWNNPDTRASIDCATATYEYRHNGGESTVRVQVVAYIRTTGREICKVIWRFDGNEAGEPEGDSTTEKDYLPILADSNEAMAIALENRVSLRLGEFSKPIVRKNGAALSGITVHPVGATPGDVNVTSEGVVSGTMTEDLVGETLTLETTWADGLSSYVMTNILTFAKRAVDNTTPYLAGSLPAAASVTAYTGSGNQDTYKVFAYDEEANTLTYKWFFDDDETAYTQNWFTPKSSDLGEEGSTHTVACYACESDGAHQEIPLKTWTLTTASPTFAIRPSTFGAEAAVGGSAGLLEFRQPDSTTYCLRLDVVKGALPPGISTFGGTDKGADASVGGIYRKAGTYSFTLRGICSNGETDERDFVITVDGTDSDSKTWSVGSASSGGATTKSALSLLGTEGKGDATMVSTITQALLEGAAAGDTINVYATDGGSEDLSAFRYLEGITVTVHCTISLAVGKHVPDLTPFAVEAGKGYQFKLSFDAEKYIIEDDSYGALAPIAKLNEDTPYSLDWSLGAPYFIGTPAPDEDGYLSVAVGLTYNSDDTDLLHIPDIQSRRDVVFENATFAKNVKVVTDGVLPATITFKGTNTFVGTFNYLSEGYQDEMKMIVKSNAAMVFAGGALYDSKLGGLVLEPGATLKFNPADEDMIFYGYRLYLPKAGEGKVRFELTGTREASAGAYNLSARYMGDDDPMNVIEIVPQPGDTTNYRVYRGEEQALMFEAVATPDAGSIDWTESGNSSTLNGTRGTAFSQKFVAQGGYRSYVYSLTSGAYSWSRDTTNTFDNTVGTRELMQASYRVGASDVSAPVEIGFPFPCGTNFISKVNVGANSVAFGAYSVVLQDKGFLSFLTTLSHVYIDRQDDSFTVRYGEFASVTLTPDGKIRVAFGPAADTRYGADPQVPLYWLHDGSVYGMDFSSAEPYAGSNDVIITPSCPPGLRLEGDTLTGIPLVAGVYTVNVKVVADGTYEMTRAFTVAIGSGRLTEDKPVITVTKQPETGVDGYVHLELDAAAEFAASVTDGSRMRWMLDGTPLEVSGGTYTLTAPATRSLDAAGAKIHCLAIEADDSIGRWNWCVRKSWQIVYNRKVYIDGEFPDDLFQYLLNGDEVIVTPGTYTKPIDFLINTAQVIIRSSVEGQKPVIDLTGNDKGYTRCFRQGYYSVEYGKSGTYEQIFQPCNSALVQDFVFRGGCIEEDVHCESAMQLYPESSANYYGVSGGGVFGGSFQNCIIQDCSALDYGGGAYGAELQNCVIENCTAATGGGCANSGLMYCTVVYNVATKEAGGIDGQCTARSCIIYGNEAADKANDYDSTTTPVRLVPYTPTVIECFTTATGDPAFCSDYHLASGSPATGKGAYPTPDASGCLVFVEIEGGGTITPNEIAGTSVAIGGSVTFQAGGERGIKAILVNGEERVGATMPFTLSNVQVNTTVTFVFAPLEMKVGKDKGYTTLGAAIEAARSGDTITVDAGSYEEEIDLRSFDGELVIEAADANNPPVLDAKSGSRCVIAKRDSDEVVFRNLVFENGYAEYTSAAEHPHWDNELSGLTDEQLLADGFGGGVFGGRFENCTIRNCTAVGGKGGGAFGAKLIGCTVSGNSAGYKANDDRLNQVLGGGIYGGYAENCRVSTNSVKGYKSQVYCQYDGAGTYDAEVRNSFVWDNFIDSGATSSRTASDTKNGDNGVVIHTEEKAPTEQRLAEHTDPIPIEGTVQTYETQQEAETAAAKQVVDISTEVAKAIADQKAYEDMFEIKTVETGNGEYVNKPEVKEEVKAEIEAQIDSVLTVDDSGDPRDMDVQAMEKTLVETTPGLYYALEFSSDMSDGSFKGERHLATGSGSVKLKATSLQTKMGFWRVNVYTTPDGE